MLITLSSWYYNSNRLGTIRITYIYMWHNFMNEYALKMRIQNKIVVLHTQYWIPPEIFSSLLQHCKNLIPVNTWKKSSHHLYQLATVVQNELPNCLHSRNLNGLLVYILSSRKNHQAWRSKQHRGIVRKKVRFICRIPYLDAIIRYKTSKAHCRGARTYNKRNAYNPYRTIRITYLLT